MNWIAAAMASGFLLELMQVRKSLRRLADVAEYRELRERMEATGLSTSQMELYARLRDRF